MNARQKSLARRWVISVIVITRLLFFLPLVLPDALVPNFLQNSSWINIQIQVSGELHQLNITHQFIDPLILGLTLWIILPMYFWSNKFQRFMLICILLPILLMVSWAIFYRMDGNTVISKVLDAASDVGPLFGGLCLLTAGGVLVYFLSLGIVDYFRRDKKSS